MAGQIEKMTRMRKNILWGVLMGTIVAFCLNLFPTFYSFFHFNRRSLRTWKYHLIEGAIILWLLIILIFVARYGLYKKKLKKDSSLHLAVYDERVKLNWLKANRFAFFVVIGFTLIWKSGDLFYPGWLFDPRFTLPNGPFFVLWGCIIALVGSFLYYNREAKHE